jgi:magnesium transporter
MSLIAGLYGMNFKYMPEIGWRYGYIWSLAAMLMVAMALYYYFRHIKWL